jgi:IstB-like ATP binding protein
MIATALARGAAEAGARVYFTTAADLAARCHKAAIEGRWATMMRFYAGPRLLVLDLCRPWDYADYSLGLGGSDRWAGLAGWAPAIGSA